jgi:transglutaminase-like putative cysteine protease
MIYAVSHRTIYSYGEPVDLAHHVLRLTPRSFAHQRVVEAAIAADPLPVGSRADVDHFGNAVSYLNIVESHERFVVEARCTVDVGFPPPPAHSPPWEAVRDALAEDGFPADVEAAEFVHPTPLTPAIPAVAAYAAASFAPGRPLFDAARALTARIRADFAFDPHATDVTTPIAEVMEKRRGVCQDFAHVELAALRSLGLAARYVSGYIRTTPPQGGARRESADASHAWISVFCPGHGWVDLDPTNDLVVADEHVVLAWGRDYGDVAPIRGVILGGGRHRLDVDVRLEPRA